MLFKGPLTCGGYEGSLGFEEIDAATFAKWGIDCVCFRLHRRTFELLLTTFPDLKYDNCNVPKEWYDEWKYVPELWLGGPPNENQANGDFGTSTTGQPAPADYDWSTSTSATRFNLMRDALLKQERTIEYSLCIWGHAHVEQWANDTGHSWRMWGDIYPQWEGQWEYSWGVAPILNHASFFWQTSNFWSHNDWDMLEVGNGELTYEESRSHFAFWAALKSPLLIGTKLQGIKPEILAILANRELIAYNQDPVHGESAAPYKWGVNPDKTWNQTHPAEFWSGKSVAGTHVFVLNSLKETVTKTVDFADVPGLEKHKGEGNGGVKYSVHDMWTGEDIGEFEGEIKVTIRPHDTAALRIN